MQLATKQLRYFRLGKVNVRKQARIQARLRKNLERKVLKKYETAFRTRLRTTAKQLEDDNYDSASATVDFSNILIQVNTAHIEQVYMTVFKENDKKYKNEIKQLEDYFSVFFDRNIDIADLSRAYIQDRRLVLAGVAENFTQQVDKIISDRIDDASLFEISKEIRTKIPQISKSRAALIARTETHSAVGHAQHAYHEVAVDAFGVNLVKKWVATADGRTRSFHSSANGQEVPMDEDFLVGGARMRFVGDPRGGARNVINCRCTVVYINADDVDEAIDTAKPDTSKQPKVKIASLVGGADGSLIEDRFNEDLTVLTASIAAKLPKPRSIIVNPKEHSNYKIYYQTIVTKDKNYSNGVKDLVTTHEYGHHVDFMIGRKLSGGAVKAWSVQGLKESTFRERKKYKFNKRFDTNSEQHTQLKKWSSELFDTVKKPTKLGFIEKKLPKFEGADLCSDIIDSVTNGYFYENDLGYGHGLSYFSKGGMKQEENFANLFAIQNKPEAKAWVQKNFPSLIEDFENALTQFDLTGVIE